MPRLSASSVSISASWMTSRRGRIPPKTEGLDMDSLAATPLNALTTPGATAPRRSSDKNQDDTGSFEEALGNELATIVPHAKSTGVDLLASATAPADDTDKTVAADGTQALQAILDA